MAESIEVTTEQGKVSGNMNQDGSRNFKGIPYAKPPLGQSRLRRSEPHPGWAEATPGAIGPEKAQGCPPAKSGPGPGP